VAPGLSHVDRAFINPHGSCGQYAGVIFKPLTDKLIKIETALFVRRDQMKDVMQDFVNTALAKLKPSKVQAS
jgi:hypothetical protein